MKTHEKIKKGIECCQTMVRCSVCTYNDIGCNAVECQKELFGDSLVLINQLESREKKLKSKITQLEQRIAQAERERDAAVNDLCTICATCKYNDYSWCKCKIGLYYHGGCNQHCDSWKWRGICEENGKEEQQ